MGRVEGGATLHAASPLRWRRRFETAPPGPAPGLRPRPPPRPAPPRTSAAPRWPFRVGPAGEGSHLPIQAHAGISEVAVRLPFRRESDREILSFPPPRPKKMLSQLTVLTTTEHSVVLYRWQTTANNFTQRPFHGALTLS